MSMGVRRRIHLGWIGWTAIASALLWPLHAQARLPVCNGSVGQNAITTTSHPTYSAADEDDDVTLSGTAQSNAIGVEVRLNSNLLVQTSLPGASSEQRWSITVDGSTFGSLPDGVITAVATVRLPADGTASAGSLTMTKDTSAPGRLVSFSATGGSNQVALAWTLPGDADVTATRVLQSTVGFASTPSSSTDQTVAFEGSGSSTILSSLSASTTYYFTAFVRDAVGNWSERMTAAATTNAAPPPPTKVSFSDDFEDCTSSSDLGSQWTTSGIWYCRSGKARGESATSVALANTAAMANTDLTARVQLSSATKGNAGLVARAAGGSYYAVRALSTGKVQVVRVNGTSETVLGEVDASIKPEPSSFRLRLRVAGSSSVQLDVWLNGSALLTVQDSSSQRLTSGQAGLYNNSTTRAQFDDFEVASF